MPPRKTMKPTDKVQEASEESFPASDAPGWIAGAAAPRGRGGEGSRRGPGRGSEPGFRSESARFEGPARVLGASAPFKGRGRPADHDGNENGVLDALLAGLNEDLAAELGTIIRYNYQAGRAYGPIGEHLRELFRAEVMDELGHAAFLTDVIVDLGGEPTTTPMEFPKPETLREALELDLEMEHADIERYKEHALLAEELGEIEIKLKLEEIAADESRHARQIQRLLKGL